MNWLKTANLIATTLVLLGIDALIGLSGTLYMPSIAGFGLVAFRANVLARKDELRRDRAARHLENR